MATNRDFKVKNGLIVSGDIQQDNAQYLRSRLSNGTSTRTFGINGANTIYIGSIDTATGGDMIVLNGTERMRITTNGDVGIGTGSPSNYGAGYTSFAVNGSTGGIIDTWSGGARAASLFSTGGEARLDAFGSRPWNFYTGNTQRMQITAAGLVGIGGAPTTNQLEVYHAANGIGMRVRNTTTGVELATRNDATTTGLDAGNASGGMTFSINTVERMRVGSNGNVTIGATSTAVGKLAVESYIAGADAGIALQRWSHVYNNGANGHSVYVKSTGNFGTVINSDWGSRLSFGVLPNTGNDNTTFVEHMTILPGGNVAIGTTSASRKLTVVGNAGIGILPTNQDGISTLSASSAGITLLDCFHNTLAQQFVVQVQATGGASTVERLRVNASGVTVTGTVTETSTIRIKKNVRPIKGALEKVMGLQGVVYDMIDDSAHEQHGLIAEEVQKVLPNVVYRDEDGEIAGVQYARVVAVLIEAMKEQEARIKALEAIIAKG